MIKNIEIFDVTITSYLVLWLIGVFVVSVIACKRAEKNKIDDNDMIITLLIIGIGVAVGSHLLYGATNYEGIVYVFQNLHIIDSFSSFVEVCVIIFGGAVYYGGLIGGIFVGYIYMKKQNADIDAYCLILTPLIPLFHFFGRIGCFLSGCCYGVECSVGFTYTYAPIIQANSVVRFPIQLVEAGFNILLFILLGYIAKNKNFKRHILSLYLILYAIIRFVLEFWRGDDIRGFLFGVSTSQIISLVILIVVPIHWYFAIKSKQKV